MLIYKRITLTCLSSTGLPKPIYQTQKSCLANYAVSLGMKGLITLPLLHNPSIHLYNADLPLTILREYDLRSLSGCRTRSRCWPSRKRGFDCCGS